MSNFNVQNKEWLDIAFENRNKAYGAYQLRKESDTTTIKAMLITFGALAIGIGLFSFTSPEPKYEETINCPLTPVEKIRLVKIKPIVETKPILKKGTEKPKLNLTPDKVPPVVVNEPEVKPIPQPENPDTSSPYNPNGIENGNPLPAGNPNGTDTKPTSPTNGTGTTTPSNNLYTGVLGVEASFPGGIDKFRAFIADNYKVPETFDKDFLLIELVFVIEKDGSMTDIKMIGKGDKALEKEAIRVLKAMKKKWTPGKVNGETVRSEKRLPIKINLTEIED